MVLFRASALFYTCISLLTISIDPASAAPKRPIAKASPACAKLQSDYEMASKQLSLNEARSATRSPLQKAINEGENIEVLNKAKIVLDLMRGNACRLPAEAPSASKYQLAALSCLLEEKTAVANAEWAKLGVKSATPAGKACDLRSWKPDQ